MKNAKVMGKGSRIINDFKEESIHHRSNNFKFFYGIKSKKFLKFN